MEEGRPSATAMMAAMARAAHIFLDAEPKVLQDDLALRLSGVENEAALRATTEAILSEIARHFTPEFARALFTYYRAFAVMRSRYTEDELNKAVGRGVSQYVILGAGLDSFAYRQRDLLEVLQVFEVDHPATQQWKRVHLRTLGIEPPRNLTFIPIDFEKQTLADGLRVGGYRSERPAFFSWLGVTQYLTEETVFDTLGFVAATAPDSEIVFEYSLHDSLLDDENRHLLAVFKARSAALGEPWLSLFDPTCLAARLKGLGFTHVWDFGPEEANTQYFAGRTDRLCVPHTTHLMKARVGEMS